MGFLAEGGGSRVRFSLRGPAWLGGGLGGLYHEALQAGLTPLAEEIKAAARAAYAGTTLAAGFGYRTAGQPAAAITLFQTDPLFPLVEYPTRAHMIYPRYASVLHWIAAGGTGVFARAVRHPGTKGKHLIDPILATFAPRFREACIQAVRTAAYHD